MDIKTLYNKHYKKMLLVSALLIALSLAYLVMFYNSHGDIINRDISLTGGTTVTIYSANISIPELESFLSKNVDTFSVRSIIDNTGRQSHVIVTVPPSERDTIKPLLEEHIGYNLTDENSSIEFTGSALSADFYKQLQIAILFAFLLMALVVFFIYGTGVKNKILVTVLTLAIFIFLIQGGLIFTILSILLALYLIYIYITRSIPSFTVIFCVFADILMTLAVVDMLGMKVSMAGIAALMMLIGYSVDTDILLTSRVLRRKDSSMNHALFGAFKTGMTMTVIAIISILSVLLIIQSSSEVLKEIFTIMLIGLGFDVYNTWVTNVAALKWYMEKKQ